MQATRQDIGETKSKIYWKYSNFFVPSGELHQFYLSWQPFLLFPIVNQRSTELLTLTYICMTCEYTRRIGELNYNKRALEKYMIQNNYEFFFNFLTLLKKEMTEHCQASVMTFSIEQFYSFWYSCIQTFSIEQFYFFLYSCIQTPKIVGNDNSVGFNQHIEDHFIHIIPHTEKKCKQRSILQPEFPVKATSLFTFLCF